MNNIKIVEYDTKYAAGVAEMWNKSSECWGGYNNEITAGSVVIEEANSTHLNLFLAMEGDEVVGYCKISVLEEDEGALYIDLLNVIPEYHGKKIGKQLVLECVNRTIKLGWPRVDLYTWPGNEKAVPLYKKCGFFWEKRDGGTHLMNFMPQILNCKLFDDFFNEVDWYNDSKRIIGIVKDGVEKRGFDFYNYHWAKDDKYLKIDICRRSRMITRIDCNEYLLETSSPKLKHVFGTTSQLDFRFVNKTEKPITLEIQGKDDKNINFAINETMIVEKDIAFKKAFDIGVVDKEQVIRKTYPSVVSVVKINGKEVKLGIPVETLFPVELELNGELNLYRTGKEKDIFLNLRNNMEETVTIATTLPEQDGFSFKQRDFKIKLNAKEKKTVNIPVVVDRSVMYNQSLQIDLKTESGKSLDFTRKCKIFLGTGRGEFSTKSDEFMLNGTGEYIIKVDQKHNLNRIRLSHLRKNAGLTINAPKLGKPFSAEFLKKKAEKIVQNSANGIIETELTFVSDEIKDIEITFNYQLAASGIGNCRISCTNRSGKTLDKNLCFSLGFYMGLGEIYIPYRNKIIHHNSVIQSNKGHWKNDDITDRWLFSKYDVGSIGLFWNSDVSFSFTDEELYFNGNIGKLKHNEVKKLNGFSFAIHCFESFREFKTYYDQKPFTEISYQDQLDLIVNDGNPFVDDKLTGRFEEQRQTNPIGEVKFSSLNELFPEQKRRIMENEKVRELEWIVEPKAKLELDVVRLYCDLRPEVSEFHKVIFPLSKKEMVLSCEKRGDDEIHKVDNGVVNFCVSKKFGPLIFSMQYKEEEWLDSEYPERVCRSWWNPWTGGIASMPSSMPFSAFLDENYTTEFGQLIDSKGNIWKGIKHIVSIKKYERYKGLVQESYYLTMPGVPLVMVVNKLVSKQGKFNPNFYHAVATFLGDKGKIEDLSCTISRKNGNIRKLHAGFAENWISTHKTLKFGWKGRETNLYAVINDDIYDREFATDLHTCCNWNTQVLHLKDGETKYSKPLFYLFSNQDLKDEWFKDLAELKIRVEDNE